MLLLLLGCVDSWCARFNLDCTIESATITPGVDADGDLWSVEEDCDDTDPSVNPSVLEICDEIDNDCVGGVDDGLEELEHTVYIDADGDTWGAIDSAFITCFPTGEGQVPRGEDCDDADDFVNPGRDEICNDGVDNDCDATTTCRLEGQIEAFDLNPQIRSGQEGDGASAALAAVDDIEGDGAGEILVGAPGTSEDGAVAAGRVYLVSSSYVAIADYYYDLSLYDVSPVWFQGETAGARLGAAVDARGGVSRLEVALLGAPGAGGLVEGAGSAVVFEDATSGTYGESAADGLFRGDEAGDGAGSAVRLVEDYDGDGAEDALVGAPGRGEGAGAAWLLRGPLAGDLEENASLIEGDTPGEAAGAAVLAADFDGSGEADLIVGAPGGDAIYLLRDGELPASLADAERFSGDDGSGLGASLAAQDLDGDGLPEILVGAPGGGYAAALRGDLAETWRCTSDEAGDFAGFSVAAGGDLDGDGAGDLAVGAPLAAGGGSVYAIYGPLGGGCVLQTAAPFSVYGGTTLGAAVLGGLQVDGEAGYDLVLGDPGLPLESAGEPPAPEAGVISLVLTHGL